MQEFRLSLFFLCLCTGLYAADPLVYYGHRSVTIKVDGLPAVFTPENLIEIRETYPNDWFEFFRNTAVAKNAAPAQARMLREIEEETGAKPAVWIVNSHATIEGFQILPRGFAHLPRVEIEYHFNLISFSPLKDFKLFGDPELLFVTTGGGVWDTAPLSSDDLNPSQADRWLGHGFLPGSAEYKLFRRASRLLGPTTEHQYHMELKLMNMSNGGLTYLPLNSEIIPVARSWEVLLKAKRIAGRCAHAILHGF